MTHTVQLLIFNFQELPVVGCILLAATPQFDQKCPLTLLIYLPSFHGSYEANCIIEWEHYFVPLISSFRAKPTWNYCACVVHSFSLMGAFAGQLKVNGLIEQACWRCVHSEAIYRAFLGSE